MLLLKLKTIFETRIEDKNQSFTRFPIEGSTLKLPSGDAPFFQNV
jgi:hypothetical protein